MKPTLERRHPAGPGIQKIYRFDNGYGASVVNNPYSYGGDKGLWELAVLRFTGSEITNFDLSYDTPITNDVLGWLSKDDVEKILKQIEALPKVEPSGADS